MRYDMKKHIGVLTYNSKRILNYGGVLQGYALNRKVRTILGEEYQVLNYNYFFKTTYHSFLKRFISFAYKVIVNLLPSEALRVYRTHKFYKLFLDKKKNYPNTLNTYIEKNFSFTFLGSDQVWNPKINNYDNNFSLSNLNKNQIATYAVSFGSATVDDKYFKILMQNLVELDCISLREKSGINILKSLNTTKRVDLDPTLLLTSEEWDEVIFKSNKSLPRKRYLFCYIMPGDALVVNSLINYANLFSRKLNLVPIFCGQKHFAHFTGKKIFSLGPLEWMNYVKNSSFVITNSFHGVAFSENFKVPFVYVRNFDRKKDQNDLSSRVIDFLSSIGEDFRILPTNFNENVNLNKLLEINPNVEGIILKKREDSIKYLKTICYENIKK